MKKKKQIFHVHLIQKKNKVTIFAIVTQYNIQTYISVLFFCFFFNCDSLHSRLNSHYEAWSYKKKKHIKIKTYRKSVWKEPTVKRCLLILDLKPLKSLVKGKHSIGREFQNLPVRGKKLLTY